MRKTYYTMLAACLLAYAPVCDGQVLAKWPADPISMKNPTNVAASIAAGPLTRANGISSINFTPAGAATTGWPTALRKESVDYYEVCLVPEAGITLSVTELIFSERRSADGIRAFEIYWSNDGFATAVRLDSVQVPDDINTRSHGLSGLNLDACNGAPICFRFYGYNAESETGSWQIAANTLEVRGNVLSACSPPAISGTVSFSNLTTSSFQINFGGGNGDSRLVAVCAGAPVNAAPCNGEAYTANPIYGQGSLLRNEAFVVYEGAGSSVTVTGLTDGQTYYVAVFERNDASLCYKQSAPAIGFQATLCQSPALVRKPIASPGSSIANLMWDSPLCYDEVLVVASTQPIAQTPSGNGAAYSANPQFGQGSGFAANAFPVFKGIGNSVLVTGLSNGTVYYFKFFIRKGNGWTGGTTLDVVPREGCTELGGYDVVFINELHYNNTGEDQDEGVELFGPAGTSLDPYELHFYKYTSPGKCAFYMSFPIFGVIPNQSNGHGAMWFAAPNMVDNSGAIALYNRVSQTVVQLFGYRQTLVAQDGVAAGMSSTQGVDQYGGNPSEFETFASGTSMQAVGIGNCPSDFLWEPQLSQSRGQVNTMQSPLPIELIDFTATLIGERVLLKWHTASELNNDYMTIERSTSPQSGLSFVEIGRVAGAGTVLEPRNYSLWDERPETGLNYYRLRQVDFDGRETYSELVVVRVGNADTGELQAAPNPASGQLFVQWPAAGSEDAALYIVDANGRLLQSVAIPAGATGTTLDVGDLAPGTYVLRQQDGRTVRYRRFLKQ
ncbi:MAG: T9SS type A sorting domain-containing protein [Saprospiraceae bacterium]